MLNENNQNTFNSLSSDLDLGCKIPLIIIVWDQKTNKIKKFLKLEKATEQDTEELLNLSEIH